MKIKSRQFLAMSAVLAFTLSIAITSCKKDKDDSPKPLSATINGTSYEFSGVNAVAANGSILIQGEMTKDTLSYINIRFEDTVKVNTAYDFDDVDVTYYDNKKNAMYMSFGGNAHGAIKLSTFDKTGKKVAGTFSGVLYSWTNDKDSAVITNGQFSSTYFQ